MNRTLRSSINSRQAITLLHSCIEKKQTQQIVGILEACTDHDVYLPATIWSKSLKHIAQYDLNTAIQQYQKTRLEEKDTRTILTDLLEIALTDTSIPSQGTPDGLTSTESMKQLHSLDNEIRDESGKKSVNLTKVKDPKKINTRLEISLEWLYNQVKNIKTPSAYSSRIKYHFKTCNYEAAHQVWIEAHLTLENSLPVFITYLRALDSSLAKNAIPLMQKLVQEYPVGQHLDCQCLLLEALVNKGHEQEAIDLYEKIKAIHDPIHPHHRLSFIHVLVAQLDIPQALDQLDLLKTLDKNLFQKGQSVLISKMASVGALDYALELYQSSTPTTDTIYAIVNAYCQRHQIALAHEFLLNQLIEWNLDCEFRFIRALYETHATTSHDPRLPFHHYTCLKGFKMSMLYNAAIQYHASLEPEKTQTLFLEAMQHHLELYPSTRLALSLMFHKLGKKAEQEAILDLE